MPRANIDSYLKDISVWYWSLIFQPFLMAFYLWNTTTTNIIIEQIKNSETIAISEEEQNMAIKVRSDIRWPIISLLISFIGLIIYVPSRDVIDGWASNGAFQTYTTGILGMFGTYAVSMLVLGLISNAYIIRRIFHGKQLNINPLHHDKCGGLRFLGAYFIKISILAIVVGFMIGLTVYRFINQDVDEKYWILYLSIPVYILLWSILFFSNILTVHDGMSKARNKLTKKISKTFSDDYFGIHQNIPSGAEELKSVIEKLHGIKSLYDITMGFPVWPFEVKNFPSYFFFIATPFIGILTGFIQDLISSRLSS